jgi:hypothetical protein
VGYARSRDNEPCSSVSDHEMDEAEPTLIPDTSMQPDLSPSPVVASQASHYISLPASLSSRRRRQPLPRHPDAIPSEGPLLELGPKLEPKPVEIDLEIVFEMPTNKPEPFLAMCLQRSLMVMRFVRRT